MKECPSMVNVPKITQLLSEVVGPEKVTDKDFDIIPYTRDLSPAKQKFATHIVMPETREEVQGILKIANDNDVPVYVRGGGTSHWDAFLPQETAAKSVVPEPANGSATRSPTCVSRLISS